ncbi:MAG: metal-dependent transcriptional regulator [Candidatus Lokiarchaeota archaeon]|nr:metal-dependent transcriptional regulator [Candidatus Lokiarchaeota archaeon]
MVKILELDLDYKVLKALFRSETPLKVGDLSKRLIFPHSTIGSCVKRLEDNGHVIYTRYKPVFLTEKGKNLAIELIRHSRLLEMLLINELGLDNEIAHEESEKFNLLFSCETINKICRKYNHPKECPCGESILTSQRCNCNEEVQD